MHSLSWITNWLAYPDTQVLASSSYLLRQERCPTPVAALSWATDSGLRPASGSQSMACGIILTTVDNRHPRTAKRLTGTSGKMHRLIIVMGNFEVLSNMSCHPCHPVAGELLDQDAAAIGVGRGVGHILGCNPIVPGQFDDKPGRKSAFAVVASYPDRGQRDPVDGDNLALYHAFPVQHSAPAFPVRDSQPNGMAVVDDESCGVPTGHHRTSARRKADDVVAVLTLERLGDAVRQPYRREGRLAINEEYLVVLAKPEGRG